jgi:hypothetical protein
LICGYRCPGWFKLEGLKSSTTSWFVCAMQSWLDATEATASNMSFVFMGYFGC